MNKSMKPSNKNSASSFTWISRLVIPVLLVLLIGCATSPSQEPMQRRVFRGEWHDYYNRAMRSLNQQEMTRAHEDLLRALALEPVDSHQKRTYGVRFQSYYPQRELGILAYYQGNYQDALERLESSLTQAPTSRARYYMNLARRQWIETEALDRESPRILLSGLAKHRPTNQRIYSLEGVVTDDTFVSSLIIHNREEFIELSQPRIEFQSHIELTPGRNEVILIAGDLAGNQTRETVVFDLDVEGPTLSINEMRVLEEGARLSVWLQGEVYDRSGIKQAKIGDVHLSAGKPSLPIEQWFSVEANSEDLPFFLLDRCGNITQGSISLSSSNLTGEKMGLGNESSGVLLASADRNFLEASASSSVPKIDFGNLASGHKVYQEEFFIDGTVYDASGVVSLHINGTPVEIPQGRQVHFSHLARLTPGHNQTIVEAENVVGGRTQAALELELERASARLHEQRLAVAYIDLVNETGAPADILRELLKARILKSISDGKRFRIPLEREHLDQLLLEQKIATHQPLNRDMQIRLGSLIPANLLLYPEIVESGNGLDIFVKVADTQTPDTYVAILNVYHPSRNTERLDWTVQGLYLKLLDAFPLVEGSILEVGNLVMTSLSARQRIRPGANLHILREGEQVIVDGIDYGRMESDVGRLRVRRVSERNSFGIVEELLNGMTVQQGDRVLTP